jgi:magnesium chelatase subunit D
LNLASEVIRKETNTHPEALPLMVLLTDGAGNVSMGDMPPQEEAHRVAERLLDQGVRSVVINMEHAAFDQGLAQALADHLGGPCYTLHELKADHLYRAVKQELDEVSGKARP